MKKQLLTLSAALVLFAACSKDGATGSQGATGATGPAGTANITTGIDEVNPGDWSNPATGVYTSTWAFSQITNSTADLVQCWYSTDDNDFFALPVSNAFNSGDQLEYDYVAGTLRLDYLYSAAPANSFYIKVAIIPPAAMRMHPGTNWSDYNQVKNIITSNK